MAEYPATVGVVDRSLPSGDLWVFGYGSLLWHAGFEHRAVKTARIHGFHRSLCVWSWVHRGTRRNPGLVLGLDWGGSCTGRLFRVAARHRQATLAYLAAREMVTPVYVPTRCHAAVDGRRVAALTFTVDREHPQYAGRLTLETAHDVVRRSTGRGGPNRDYIAQTVEQLLELGVRDRFLLALRSTL
jgi:cation transport protein ChaC